MPGRYLAGSSSGDFGGRARLRKPVVTSALPQSAPVLLAWLNPAQTPDPKARDESGICVVQDATGHVPNLEFVGVSENQPEEANGYSCLLLSSV